MIWWEFLFLIFSWLIGSLVSESLDEKKSIVMSFHAFGKLYSSERLKTNTIKDSICHNSQNSVYSWWIKTISSQELSIIDHFDILEAWGLAIVGSNLAIKVCVGRNVVMLPHNIKTFLKMFTCKTFYFLSKHLWLIKISISKRIRFGKQLYWKNSLSQQLLELSEVWNMRLLHNAVYIHQ